MCASYSALASLLPTKDESRFSLIRRRLHVVAHVVAHFVAYTSSHTSSATLRRPHFVPHVVAYTSSPRLVDCTYVKGFDSPASYSNMWGQFCVAGVSSWFRGVTLFRAKSSIFGLITELCTPWRLFQSLLAYSPGNHRPDPCPFWGLACIHLFKNDEDRDEDQDKDKPDEDRDEDQDNDMRSSFPRSDQVHTSVKNPYLSPLASPVSASLRLP